jgi:hypothetical protein
MSRNAIRGKYNIEGNIGLDILCTLFCGCCAIIQECLLEVLILLLDNNPTLVNLWVGPTLLLDNPILANPIHNNPMERLHLWVGLILLLDNPMVRLLDNNPMERLLWVDLILLLDNPMVRLRDNILLLGNLILVNPMVLHLLGHMVLHLWV